MSVTSLDPRSAADLIAKGAVLVDIRGADEFARERISGARNAPLDSLGPLNVSAPVIFHCKSGQRTRNNAARLVEAGGSQTYLLDGGIEAWKAAGLAVRTDSRRPIEVMRQVQIIGGALVLLAVLLGWLVAPAFLAVGGAVGLGMMHAGITGSCAMANMLAPLPWNRVTPS